MYVDIYIYLHSELEMYNHFKINTSTYCFIIFLKKIYKAYNVNTKIIFATSSFR